MNIGVTFLLVLLALLVLHGGGALVFRRLTRAPKTDWLIDKYRVVEVIGEGGRGVVLRATIADVEGPGVDVALKCLRDELVEDKSAVEALRAEGKIALRLLHENIIATLEVAPDDQTPFIAMECIDGVDLRCVLDFCRREQRPLPERLVVHAALSIAQALAHMHSCVRGDDDELLRIIHCDLSPANVLIANDGAVKVFDFGTACALTRGASHSFARLTGKLAYMAPEQARGESVDERIDLYALGLILYEMLTLERVHVGSTDAELLTCLLERDPAPASSLVEVIDPAWDGLLSSLLQKDRNQRSDSAGDVVCTLGEIKDRVSEANASDASAWGDVVSLARGLVREGNRPEDA